MEKNVALIFFMLLAAAFLVCGCSTAKYEEFHSSDVVQGKGGELRDVDGMDFWENGDPDRKYKILGTIEESPKHHLPLGRVSRLFSGSDDRDSAIAKVAHKKGGDAVVKVPKAPEPATDDEQPIEGRHDNRSHQRFVFIVVKYVQ